MSGRILEPRAVETADSLSDDLRERLLSAEYGIAAEVDRAVTEIIADVRGRGDDALRDLTARYDGVDLTADRFLVSAEELAESSENIESELAAAIDGLISNVRRFHEKQQSPGYQIEGPCGSTLAWRARPLQSVGVYIPGGLAAYPTTVVMNVVPAQIAGVTRIVALTPPGSVENNPAVAYALSRLGVAEIVRLGGAQVVAAAAYGTETIRPVVKIVGPGNAYVAAAKRQVFGKVGIDSIAGPSEVVIIADRTARAEWIAWDMLAQAEHDEQARSILIATDGDLAEAVCTHIVRLAAESPRGKVVGASLAEHGAVCVASSLAVAVALSNAIAPEHLQVMVSDDELDPSQLIAGAIFWGEHSPTALGDYWAGPNHVLPTGGTARFCGPLCVDDFLAHTSVVRYTRGGAQTTEPAIRLAEAEGLWAHAGALRARIDDAD